MRIGERAERALTRLRAWRNSRLPGALGDFFRGGGNSLLVGNLPIGAEDLVIDAGGYRGTWSCDVLSRYGTRAIVFEPFPAQAKFLRDLFQHNSRVEVIEAAVGDRNGQDELMLQSDASTRFADHRASESVTIKVLDIAGFLSSRGISEIGCMKLNIEGSEYEVLERLIETGLIQVVRSLLIQFHHLDLSSAERRSKIQSGLRQSHICDFDFPFVWESWTRVRRNAPP